MDRSARKKPLILRAVSRMAVGGVQRGVLATLARADRERFDYAVLCYKKEGTWGKHLREMDVPVYTQKTLPAWDPYQIWRLSRLIRRINPDLLHIQMAPTVIPVASAALLAGVKNYIVHYHNFYGNYWGPQNALLHKWEMALTRRAKAIVAVTQAVLEATSQATGLPRELYTVVYNGIEVERFKNAAPHDPRAEWGLAPGTPLVVHVARYLDIKRIEDFIEAGALVTRRWMGENGPRPAFVVIGGGAKSYEDIYRARIRELGVEKNVILAGSRDDVPGILQTAQVGALASEMEGFGQVILEYIAAGLPVAATTLAPVMELVRDGEEALLSPPRRPEALALNIEKLLTDRELAARLVHAGRQRLRLFDWGAAVRGYEAIYARVLGL